MFYDAWKFIGSLICTRDESRVIGKFNVDRKIIRAGEDAYVRALVANAEKMYRLLGDVDAQRTRTRFGGPPYERVEVAETATISAELLNEIGATIRDIGMKLPMRVS